MGKGKVGDGASHQCLRVNQKKTKWLMGGVGIGLQLKLSAASTFGYALVSKSVDKCAERWEPAEKPMIPSFNEVAFKPNCEAFCLITPRAR